MPDRQRGAAAERRILDGRYWTGSTPAHQILDRGSSATHSSHAATQRANISLIDRRSRWPRRVPYLAIEHCNSLTALWAGPTRPPLTKKAISTSALNGASKGAQRRLRASVFQRAVRRRYLARRAASRAMPTNNSATASMTIPTRMSMAITSRSARCGARFGDGEGRCLHSTQG